MDQPTTTLGRPAVGKIQNDQEHADLLTYHLSILLKAEAAVETAKGPVTEAKAVLSEKHEDLTKAFNTAKGDLGRGYTREYLQSLMLDGRTKTTALVDRERQRARDKAALNQPVWGLQPELFPGEETPEEARDEMAWTNEGFLRGMRGDLEELQKGDPPRFQQAIMAGYRKGQEVTIERVGRAMEIIASREKPDAGAETKDLNAGGETDTETTLDEAARKLKAAGFLERSEGEGDDQKADTAAAPETFEAPAAELEKQTTRRVLKDRKAGATSGAAEEAVH